VAILRLRTPFEAPRFETAPAPRAGEILLSVGRHDPGVLASMGIVSTAGSAWKTWRGGQLDSLLRLDIGAYPRASGSALVDMQGRFAGMLTSGLTRTAPVAIPASTIERVAAELSQHGSVVRGYLGVGLQTIPLPKGYASELGRDQDTAIIVLNVAPESPAARAGVTVGDVIAQLGEHTIEDTDDVQAAIQGAAGKTLVSIVFRGGRRIEVNLLIGERRN
jgi:S1-C subfamily serine protease